ncbi:filamentous hemagglutinin N-terminal domain-containing protein [Scytonema sp. NUACC26]|uniref:filamentous hemagglutinin N-terminal domain-containing protein n=1 Tax=Scytonema sp. NUACC26 TaxID=3140176 RepID=UPI0034DCBBA3
MRNLNLFKWLNVTITSGVISASNCALYTLCSNKAIAQIAPDSTLPNNSSIQITGNTIKIEGGTTAGSNLFHSFSEFSVPTGSTAYFNNSLNIQNIISRVTGKSLSNIDGLIRANGTANLFLINPNGIIFGQNTRLDIGGSFGATTASAIRFGDRGFFSATNPNTPQLLTINPTALLFNQIRAASIENNSVALSGLNPSSEFTATGLRVPNGKSLLLVGGDIKMDGGGLYAFGGRVDLGGLANAGTVGLNSDGNNLSLSFPDSVERSDVFLSNGSVVNVTADNGGSIAVNARNLKMTGVSHLYAGIESGLGSNNSKAGNISINTTGEINLNDRSEIANRVQLKANGQGGDVNISASKLQFFGGAQVYTTTFGFGNGGSLRVNAQDVQLIARSADNQFPSALNTAAQSNSTGNAGDLIIKTNTLLARDGAVVSASTRGAGKGGSLRVDAQDVQLIARSTDNQFPSGLFATTISTGDAGDLTIKTNTLLVRDGAVVSVSTRGAGRGGSLRVDAQDVRLIGKIFNNQPFGGLFASTSSTGDARDLIINTNTLLLQDRAAINVSSLVGIGAAGNMTLNARSIRLNNNALLSASTRSTKVDPNKEQATININSKDLILARNSNITTNAIGENVIGGNIIINTNVLVAFANSDISANSTDFRGGNVKINATGIFGSQFRDAPTPNSDITATGKNQQLNGTVQVDTPDVNPNSGLVELAADFVDRSGLIAQGCPANKGSSFTITGRGGLPPLPTQTLRTNQTATVDWVTLNPQEQKSISVEENLHLGRSLRRKSSGLEVRQISPKIMEATGWVMNKSGTVELIAFAPTVTHTNISTNAIGEAPIEAIATCRNPRW